MTILDALYIVSGVCIYEANRLEECEQSAGERGEYELREATAMIESYVRFFAEHGEKNSW